MNTFIILSIITVVFLVAGILVNHYTYEDGWSFLLVCIGVLALCGLIGAGVSLINKNTRFVAVQNEYQVITEMIESYDGQDFGNMASLTEAVVHMNQVIARHKAHYNSPWTGLWYSEDIANLEPIRFTGKTPKRE